MPLTEPCSEPSGAPQTPLHGFPLGGLISLSVLPVGIPSLPLPLCHPLSGGTWLASALSLFLISYSAVLCPPHPVMLSTVTAAEVQPRATSEPSFPGHCLLLFPAPAGRPAFSPVLLQCRSFDDRKPQSHQEAPLTCAWEARLLRSQGMEEAGGCVPHHSRGSVHSRDCWL